MFFVRTKLGQRSAEVRRETRFWEKEHLTTSIRIYASISFCICLSIYVSIYLSVYVSIFLLISQLTSLPPLTNGPEGNRQNLKARERASETTEDCDAQAIERRTRELLSELAVHPYKNTCMFAPQVVSKLP